MEAYTFESQEIKLHHQHTCSMESQPILIQSVLKEYDEKQLATNPQSPEKTIKVVDVNKPSTPIHLRGQSEAVGQEECNITKHHRFTSDTNFGIFLLPLSILIPNK